MNANYSSVILAKKPVGYWRLGEAVGPTAVDASGFGRHGTYNGNPTFGQPGAIVNDPDTAIGCKGPDSKDYIEIADPGDGAQAVFSQPTSGLGLTVEAWMRPDTLVFRGQPSGRDFYIHWLGKCVSGSGQCEWGLRFYNKDSQDRSNRISAYLWSPEAGEGAGAYFQDDLTDVVGKWMHIVAVYEPGDKDTPGAGVRIYRDGIKRLGPPQPGTLYSRYGVVPVHGTLPVRLGTRDAARSGGAALGYLTGGVDEVAIYPYALDDRQVMENYNAGQAGN
jgi:Concanavalin A-like lectin/glucanases superfamily